MDNLTHSLTGLVIAKAGMERFSPAATVVCVIAANAPDFDLFVLLTSGRWAYLQHHRGITHSIPGVLLLAILIPTLFYAAEFVVAHFWKRARRIRFGWLLLASLIATATHPLMDWTNNYGIRLLLPWSAKWFYGDLVFIVDPLIWIILGGTAFLLTSRSKMQMAFWAVLALALILLVFLLGSQPEAIHLGVFRFVWLGTMAAFFLARRYRFGQCVPNALALTALGLVVAYWSALGLAHRRAYAQADRIANEEATKRSEKLMRVAAMPRLADPFHWQCISETEGATYRFEVSLAGPSPSPNELERFAKPNPNELRAIEAASQDARARVFLGFARFPGAQVKDLDCVSQTVVQFADLRYTEPGGARRGTFALDVPIACPEAKEK
jgi:inner membrane protein